jgi:hypothetical protein
VADAVGDELGDQQAQVLEHRRIDPVLELVERPTGFRGRVRSGRHRKVDLVGHRGVALLGAPIPGCPPAACSTRRGRHFAHP